MAQQNLRPIEALSAQRDFECSALASASCSQTPMDHETDGLHPEEGTKVAKLQTPLWCFTRSREHPRLKKLINFLYRDGRFFGIFHIELLHPWTNHLEAPTGYSEFCALLRQPTSWKYCRACCHPRGHFSSKGSRVNPVIHIVIALDLF